MNLIYCDEVIDKFHYTTVNGLIGILKNNSLRLSSHRAMNDSKELLWFQDIAMKRVFKYLQDNLLLQSHIPFYEDLKKSLIQLPFTLYLASFADDPDLLSQWRAYGDDGCGVSIGFNLEENVFNKGRPSIGRSLEDSMGYEQISYCNEKQSKMAESILELFLKAVEKIEDGVKKKKVTMDSLALEILLNSMLFKSASFAEEKETRIMLLPSKNKLGQWLGSPSKIEFKEPNLASYFEWRFCKAAITKITLGPKCQIDERELELFLDEYEYEHVIIERSVSTYC